MKNFKLFIALRYLKGQRKSPFSFLVTLFSVGGIFVGVSALIIVLSVMNGFEREIRTRIIGMTAHITLYSVDETIKDWKPIIEKIKKEKEVVFAAPFVISKVGVIGKGAIDAIMLRGGSPQYENSVSEYMTLGKFELNTQKDGLPTIILGNYLAERLGVTLGDTIQLIFPRGSSGSILGIPATNTQKFEVCGIFNVGLYEYDSEIAYVELGEAQKLLGLGNAVTGIEIRVKNFYRANKISKRIAELVGLQYYTMSWTETNKNLFSWIMIEKWTMFLLLSLIIGVAAFNIVSTLIMVVIEKTREIGILKALGVSSRGIMEIFVYQALLVGLVGTILGTAFGIAVCLVQEKYKIISLPPEIYSISALPVDLRGIDIIFIILFTFAIILFSSLYPSKKAGKMMPIDAIRYG